MSVNPARLQLSEQPKDFNSIYFLFLCVRVLCRDTAEVYPWSQRWKLFWRKWTFLRACQASVSGERFRVTFALFSFCYFDYVEMHLVLIYVFDGFSRDRITFYLSILNPGLIIAFMSSCSDWNYVTVTASFKSSSWSVSEHK